jgi:hypothetical protein
MNVGQTLTATMDALREWADHNDFFSFCVIDNVIVHGQSSNPTGRVIQDPILFRGESELRRKQDRSIEQDQNTRGEKIWL